MQSHSKIDEIIENQKTEIEKQKQETENMKLVCKSIFDNQNGKYFLKYLKNMCLWSEQDININTEILIYKKARRDIWAIIRNFIPKEILAQIEIYEE